MKIYEYIKNFIVIIAFTTMNACSNDDYLLSNDDYEVAITFRPSIDGKTISRTIGDATNIDQLIVNVYEGTETLSQLISYSDDWEIAQRNGITLSLVKGRTYHILFWAQDADNTAYQFTDNGNITADYTDYINGGFSKMEELDAFYGISTVTIHPDKGVSKEVSLSRPFALLNFADKDTQPQPDTHCAVVTYHNIPASFHPFTGKITSKTNDISFTFTDFPEETLEVDEKTYYYVASNYLFAPSKGTTHISATLDLQKSDGTSINKIEFKGDKSIMLERNKKTNVLGTITQLSTTQSIWGGTIPTTSPLTTDEQNRYTIDEANDIAWLSVEENTLTLGTNSTFIFTIDIDMANSEGLTAIQLPSGSTLDGNGHSIKGLKLNEGLLGNATDITVKNLTIEESTIEYTGTEITHVGVLVNTVKGNGTFSNIHIKNSSATTTNGAAGGIVGYISRKEADKLEENLTVTFDNCHITETTIRGTYSNGHFVGLFRGYDDNEVLQFNSNCTLSTSASATQNNTFDSPYREGNESVWLADNDYTQYNDWLGNEECYRGTVMYGENRFVPCWDGKTSITPLTDADGTLLIHSAFDLASLQDGKYSAVTFKEDVDLDGERTNNKNLFTPIKNITKLDGGNHKLYNLNIFHNNTTVGFINGTSGETEHKNLHFVNSSVRADMKGDESNVYVGTLCPVVYTKYTVDNITITNGYVLGLGKVGGLIGFVTAETSATLDCKNCCVTASTIENMESSTIEYFGEAVFGKQAGFYPQGEAGGLIGFIGNDATITDCKVTDTEINCYGQDDKLIWVTIFPYNVPGRHVNQFIGDIRTINKDNIILSGCSAENNTYGRKENNHSKDVTIIGKCYDVPILDEKGTLTIDGKSISF